MANNNHKDFPKVQFGIPNCWINTKKVWIWIDEMAEGIKRDGLRLKEELEKASLLGRQAAVEELVEYIQQLEIEDYIRRNTSPQAQPEPKEEEEEKPS